MIHQELVSKSRILLLVLRICFSWDDLGMSAYLIQSASISSYASAWPELV